MVLIENLRPFHSFRSLNFEKVSLVCLFIVVLFCWFLFFDLFLFLLTMRQKKQLQTVISVYQTQSHVVYRYIASNYKYNYNYIRSSIQFNNDFLYCFCFSHSTLTLCFPIPTVSFIVCQENNKRWFLYKRMYFVQFLDLFLVIKFIYVEIAHRMGFVYSWHIYERKEGEIWETSMRSSNQTTEPTDVIYVV